MSSLLKQKEFDLRCVIKPISKISGVYKKTTPDTFYLPEYTVLHYISDTSADLGVDRSCSILRNHYAESTIYHVLELKAVAGSPISTNVKASNLKISYHRSHLEIKEISNLDRSISINKNPLVINYALLNKLYNYKSSSLSIYNEWLNIRSTLWDMVRQIGSRRIHFIKYQIPQRLPSKNELNKYLNHFNAGGLNEFFTNDTFDILELWQIVHLTDHTVLNKLDEEVIYKIYLTFIESGIMTTICLGDLIEWATTNVEEASNALYKFLDSLIAIRNPTDIKDIEHDLDTHEPLEINHDSTIVKMINENGAAGNLSSAEQRALLKLSQKYKTIKDPHGSDKTLDQMDITDEDLKIDKSLLVRDDVGYISKNMLTSTVHDMDKKYVKDVLPKHIVQMVLKMQDGGIIIKDMKMNTKIDVANKVNEYSVQTLPIAGESATLHFTLPHINEDGTFLVDGTKYRLDKQKGELPIVKTRPNVVALTSYYGKLFMVRTESSNLNYSKWIIKVLDGNDIKNNPNGVVSNLTHGINTIKDKVPRAYSAIAETFRSFTISKQYDFVFTYSQMDEFFSPIEIKEMKEHHLVPCGRHNKSLVPIGMDSEGKLYELVLGTKGPTEIIYLGTIPNLISEDLPNGPIEFNEIGIFGKQIAIIILLMYNFGLEKTLELLKVSYRLEPTNIRIPYNPNEYILKCKDTVYVIDISNPFRRLIIGGLYTIRDISNRYKSIDFNHKQTYGSIFTSLGLSVHYLKEIALLWDMYIDPITEKLLSMEGSPTDFTHLILHASDLLIDDHMPDVKSVRYKGYERIVGMLYRELIVAMRDHRSKGSSGTTFTINPKAVMLSIQQDQTQTLVEESNPIHNLKEKESITHVGSGGRSADTMMRNDRGFTKSDVGVLSESTPDSGKVGIRGYLTPDANFDTTLGTTKEYDISDNNPNKVLSTSALLSPAVMHDDGKRINFISIQNTHTVACDGYDVLPYRTGYEEVLAGRTDDLFAVKAEDDGIVLDVTSSMLSVEYKNGKKKNYEVGIKHGIVSGKTIPHNRITDLTKGHKFKKLDILVFDSGFFQRSELNPHNVVYKPGTLMRIAFIDNASTLEDGVVLTHKIASKLFTPRTKVYCEILDFDTIIHDLVTIGDEVTPETILCTREGFVNDEIQSKNPEAIKALQKVSANNPKADTYGKITHMEVIYYGKIEDMHPSLQKIATKYDNLRSKKVNALDLDHAKTGKINSSIRVNGVKLEQNQMAIRIYIDSLLEMVGGDKMVIGHQLKCTVSYVTPYDITAEDGTPIDGEFGASSQSNRIVESIIYLGMMCEIIPAANKRMADIYFDK